MIVMKWTEAIRSLKIKGQDLRHQMAHRTPQTVVIILASDEDGGQVSRVNGNGGRAHHDKNADAVDLDGIIKGISSREHIVTEDFLIESGIAERVLRRFQDLPLAGGAVEALAAPLTSRELEVLTYVARGYGNKRIASTLCVSEQTIKNHVTSVLRKLDANDRTHAVVMALRHGWISMTEREEAVPV